MVCFLDVDGVLADFQRGVHLKLGVPYDVHNWPYALGAAGWGFYRELGLTIEQLSNLCNFEFWENLPWTWDGHHTLDTVREYFDEEAKSRFQTRKGLGLKLHFTHSVEESQAINRMKSGVIIMAGSGMCEGGRIAHHLKHNLWRPECSIVFAGFQAKGTLGRRIVDGMERVRVLGEDVAVRAKVYTIGGFSAHADQKELLEWLGSFSSKPEVFIVHGEENVALEFEGIVKERLGFVTHVPHRGDEFDI